MIFIRNLALCATTNSSDCALAVRLTTF